MDAGALPWEARSDGRDKVLHRVRLVTTDGAAIAATLVDISPGGFMVRAEAVAVHGDRLSLDLPLLGRVTAEVRWALGGRIGCRFETTIPAAEYPPLLAALSS